MRREMDFAESDWAAMRWALGSAAAICRHALIGKVGEWRDRVRWLPSVLSGMAAAGLVLIISVAALLALTLAPRFGPDPGTVEQLIFFILIPELIYALSAVVLWRSRRTMACGILAAGAILITHSIFHFIA